VGDIKNTINKVKEEIANLKTLKYKAIALAIILFAGAIILGATHIFITLTKSSTVNVGAGCPYIPSSLGLQSNIAILKSLSTEAIGVIYKPVDGGKSIGVIASYRNAILDSTAFQIVRILLVVLVITVLGFSFALGFTDLRVKDILKRILILFLFLWATSSGTYEIYDDFIEPLTLRWYEEVANLINGAILTSTVNSSEVAQYVQNNQNNEFVMLDAIIASFFSQTIFDKLGGLVFLSAGGTTANVVDGGGILNIIINALKGLNVLGFLALVIMMGFYLVGIYLFIQFLLFAVEIVFLKLVIVIGLALFPLFVMFTVSFTLNPAVDKFSVFFKRYAESMLIKPAISIILLTAVTSLVGAMILGAFAGAFSFYSCVVKVFNSLPSFYFGKFYYFGAFKPKPDEIYGFLSATNQVLNIKADDSTIIIFFMMLPNLLFILFLATIFHFIIDRAKAVADSFNLGFAFGGDGMNGVYDAFKNQLGNMVSGIQGAFEGGGKVEMQNQARDLSSFSSGREAPTSLSPSGDFRALNSASKVVIPNKQSATGNAFPKLKKNGVLGGKLEGAKPNSSASQGVGGLKEASTIPTSSTITNLGEVYIDGVVDKKEFNRAESIKQPVGSDEVLNPVVKNTEIKGREGGVYALKSEINAMREGGEYGSSSTAMVRDELIAGMAIASNAIIKEKQQNATIQKQQEERQKAEYIKIDKPEAQKVMRDGGSETIVFDADIIKRPQTDKPSVRFSPHKEEGLREVEEMRSLFKKIVEYKNTALSKIDLKQDDIKQIINSASRIDYLWARDVEQKLMLLKSGTLEQLLSKNRGVESILNYLPKSSITQGLKKEFDELKQAFEEKSTKEATSDDMAKMSFISNALFKELIKELEKIIKIKNNK
jgi:hypothetical protein